MRHQSLYTYFPSKQAIYDAMFAQGMGELVDRGAGLVLDPIPSPLFAKQLGRFLSSASRTRFATSFSSSGWCPTSYLRPNRWNCRRRLSPTSSGGIAPPV